MAETRSSDSQSCVYIHAERDEDQEALDSSTGRARRSSTHTPPPRHRSLLWLPDCRDRSSPTQRETAGRVEETEHRGWRASIWARACGCFVCLRRFWRPMSAAWTQTRTRAKTASVRWRASPCPRCRFWGRTTWASCTARRPPSQSCFSPSGTIFPETWWWWTTWRTPSCPSSSWVSLQSRPRLISSSLSWNIFFL